MIEFSFVFTTCLVIFGWFCFRLGANLKSRNFCLKREALQLLMLFNLAVISRMVFHPMATVDGKIQPLIFEAATAWPFRLNLVPFVNLFDYESRRDLLLNIIGNCTMFIPTGIVVPCLYKNLRSFRKTLLTGFLISLSIEIIQLPFAVRASDIDDLILNTLGVVMGYGIYRLTRRKKA